MRILAAAAVCAGGGDRLPRSQSVAGLLDETADGRVHTLCGARIWRRDDIIHVVREHGELRRHGHGLEDGMWDGRFEVGAPGEEIVASGMVRSQLGEDDRRWLMRLPGYVRASLPVVVTEEGPVLAQGLRLALRPGWYETKGCWVLPRFRRAVCRIERETDL